MTAVLVLDALSEAQQAMYRAAAPQGLPLRFAGDASDPQDVAALLTRRTPVTAGFARRYPRARFLQQIGRFPWTAAPDLGLPLRTWPLLSRITVAEHTFALLLSLARGIPAGDAGVRAAEYRRLALTPERTSETKIAWNWLERPVVELYGKQLGLLGAGEIALEVAARARAFGMRTHYFNRTRLPEAFERAHALRYASLQEIAAQSDIVSVHLPHTAGTEGIVSREFLGRMRQGAWLVNTARGGLVDETALAQALVSGHLGGAALDVFVQEPLPEGHALLSAPGVVLSPHLGGGQAGGLPADLQRLLCHLADELQSPN